MSISVESEAGPLPEAETIEAEQRFLAYQRACLARAQAEFLTLAPRELRSPLTLIQGYSAMLAEMSKTGTLSSEQAKVTVQRITAGTARLSEIVEDVLDIAAIRAEALDLLIRPLSPVELGNLVVKGLRQTLIACQQTLSVGIPADLPPLEGDITRLRQAFQNIVGSLIQQAAPGGSVTIGGQLLAQSPPTRSAFMHFTISAPGVSLSKELVAFWAEPLAMEAVSEQGEGERRPGLKLAIAKGIIEAHGGRLWAQASKPSEAQPSEFALHVELPLRATARRSSMR